MRTKVLILLCIGAMSCLAAPVLNLTPGASISGAPGATIGWGFSIGNDTSSWLVVNSVTAGGFSASTGTFTDYIAQFNFYVVNPNSTLAVPFDANIQAGFGEFAISPGASPGSSTAGTFDVGYDLYANDPNIDPTVVDPGHFFPQLNASVQVARIPTAIPEPSTLGMIALPAGWILALRMRRR